MAQPMSQDEKPYLRRNFKLGVINGALWLLARALTDPDTVLPAFAVALMGDNPLYVGILVSFVNVGWFWPPLLMISAMSTGQRRHPYYQGSGILRVFAISGACILTYYLAADHPLAAFIGISFCYLLLTSAGGIGLIPFMSVLTDSVPANRRAKFFAMRFFFGGLMAFGAGFWVKWLLSDASGLDFPHDYALLFGIATIVTTLAVAAWWGAKEPEHKVETRSLPLRLQLLRGLRRLRTRPGFLRLIGSRLMMAASYGLVVPFLVPYAYRSLRMAEAMVGLALSIRVLSDSMSNLLWSRLSSRYGNRFLLITSGMLHLVGVAMVLAIPLLPLMTLGTLMGLEFDLRLAALMVCFGTLGAARSGQLTGQSAYVLDFTPERTRPVYLATYYLLTGPVAFMPLITALLIGVGGRYLLAFGLATIAAIATIGLYFSLKPLRGITDDDQPPHS